MMLLSSRATTSWPAATSTAARTACCTRFSIGSGIGVTLALDRSGDFESAAITPATKLIWIETPGNPLMSITDIAACAEIAHAARRCCWASTTRSPRRRLTRPLELGADMVMHSATKYLGGHSDVLGGALVVTDKELYERLYFIQNATGAVMGPLDSFFCSRGLKTLELRVREQSPHGGRNWPIGWPATRASAACITRACPIIRGTRLRARQMEGAFGAMLSFEVAGDFAAAKRFVEIDAAVSTGGQPGGRRVAHRAAGHDVACQLRRAKTGWQLGISDGLIRLSVGLEAFDDLRDDLDQALARSLPTRRASEGK